MDKLPNLSRVTQGVKLINLRENQKVTSISLVEKNEEIPKNIDDNNESKLNAKQRQK